MFTLRLLFSSTRNMMLKKMIIQKLTNYKQNFLISQIFSSHWKIRRFILGKPTDNQKAWQSLLYLVDG